MDKFGRSHSKIKNSIIQEIRFDIYMLKTQLTLYNKQMNFSIFKLEKLLDGKFSESDRKNYQLEKRLANIELKLVHYNNNNNNKNNNT